MSELIQHIAIVLITTGVTLWAVRDLKEKSRCCGKRGCGHGN